MNPARHLHATLRWIAAAQDARGEDRGVSAAFHLLRGWLPSYPETTGYIVNTLLAYSRASGDLEFARRASSAGEWLLGVQHSGGGFPGGYASRDAIPRVFNTGMVLFGLAELARAEDRFAQAGGRALEWLLSAQDDDGSWTTIAPERAPHAYHSLVALGMLEMASALPDAGAARAAANRAADWTLLQQDEDGWFRHNDLIPGLPPITHNIAYVLQGLVGLGPKLGRGDLVEAAARGALPLLRDFEASGHLAAGYARGWRRGPSFRCLTGEAQLGLVWLALGDLLGEPRYRRGAQRLAEQVADTQWVGDRGRGLPLAPRIHGGVAGAWPLWGRYLRCAYPNWAAKFFADLLMALGAPSDDR
jgi:hypothetical protein